MRKNIFGRQFKRDSNERKALFKALIYSLILNGRIKTTEAKAKAIKGEVDKIITKVKKGVDKARYLLQGQLPKEAIEKVISEIAPRFNRRRGGFTRIVRVGRRFYDNASMVLMEWTEQNEVKSQSPIQSGTKVKSLDEKVATAEAQKGTETQKFSASENSAILRLQGKY